MLTFAVVVTIVAVTSLTLWETDVKWRGTGFTSLRFLISAKCPLKSSLKVLPVCPMYCKPHFWHDSTYMAFLVLQLKHPLIGMFCFVTHKVTTVDFSIKGQTMQGALQGPDPFSLFEVVTSALISSCRRFVAFLLTTMSLLSVIHFNSPAVCKMCLLFCNILLMGGL